MGPTSAMVKEKLSDPMSDKPMLTKAKETEPHIDQNVTFRPASSHSQDSTMEDHADTLIPPYNALKIDALAEYDMDQEDDLNDAAMDEKPGTELALMEEDDLLGEDLQNVNSPVRPNYSVLMIEDGSKADTTEADKGVNKTLTRSSTRSLLSAQQEQQRRASPRINKQAQGRARRGTKATSSKSLSIGSGTTQKGMGDAKHPPHHHQ